MMFQAGWTIVTIKLVLILAFIFFTSPTSTHALAQAALSGGVEPENTEDRRGGKERRARLPDNLHIAGTIDVLPKELDESPALDSYMYQSGHDPDQSHVSGLACAFHSLRTRPVVNGEMCREGMGSDAPARSPGCRIGPLHLPAVAT